MASSAIKSEEEKAEFFDPPEVLEKKISKLVKYIRKSNHFIIFTGAGISTSCGIPDFRSGYNTVLPTGPGAWEVLSVQQPIKRSKVVKITSAVPSPTHMSFLSLFQANILKHLVSQNVDGLHRKSGIRPEQLSELHGNIYIESCSICRKEYLRDYDVVTSDSATDHNTGNQCDNPACRGELKDNIINFGEKLNSEVINTAFDHAGKADLCLAMGSSLRVNPAAGIPRTVAKNGKKLVVVNLQRTPLDHYAKLVIHALCDVVIEKVMKCLGLGIPQFRLTRFLRIERRAGQIFVEDIEEDGSDFSFLKSVSFKSERGRARIRNRPFRVAGEEFGLSAKAKLRFQKHYGEPSLTIAVNDDDSLERLRLEFNPFTGEWNVYKAV